MRSKDKKRNWIFCVVMGVVCVLMAFLPEVAESPSAEVPRVKAEILEVDNSALMPLGLVYSGVQHATVRLLSGDHSGEIVSADNYMNAALDKDKLFSPGDRALVMVHEGETGLSATLIDHYRMDLQGLLLALFGLLLVVFGGVTGMGALISLFASVLAVWKLLIPLLLKGVSPIWSALFLVVLLTAMIDFLVAGFTRRAVLAMLGSLLGTLVTCILAVVFGRLLKLDGGSLPYLVPLLSQTSMTLNVRELFFAMVFIANSGALMDLSMDIASACEEVRLHHPGITRRELLKSGFSVGRSVIGTMTTTLMLAYSGSYLSMMMYFAGQGTPIIDILNYKYIASEILTTLVGSFGLVTVAPFTALVSSLLLAPRQKRALPGEE